MTEKEKNPHKSKEEDLTKNFDFLQKVADLSPNILFVIDLRAKKVEYVSQRVKALTGYDPDHILKSGADIFKVIIHPEDYKRRMENLEKCRLLSGEEECEVKVRVFAGENRWEWYRIREKAFQRNKKREVTQVLGTAENIHEQKIGEERLREEHRRLENAQRIGNLGSFERKLPGDIMQCSEEFYRIFGIEPRPNGLTIEEFYSFVHPEDLEPLLTAVDKTHSTGEPVDTITRIVRPDNTIRHVHRRAAIVKDESGTPQSVYGTFQDISSRIKSTEEKKRMENLIRSTEALADTGSYEVDLASNKVYFSDGLFRLFGEEPGSFVPSLEWIDQRSHPEDVAVIHETISQAILDKRAYTYTRRIFRKEGELRTVEAHGKFVLDPVKGTSRIIGIVQDITKRKQAEAELKRSEERSRHLVEVLQNAPDAYLVLSPDLHIQMASDAYLKATDTERDTIIGKYVFEVFPDNPAIPEATGVKNLHASLKKVLSTKKTHRMAIQHYDVRGRDGSFIEKHWSPTNTPVINSEGEVDYIIHRVLDITEVMEEKAAVKGLVSETEMLKTSLEEVRIQANQLKENRALLQSIFDASPNSIILYKTLFDDEGKPEDFEFFKVNAYNYESLGLPGDLIGKRFSNIFPGVYRTGILEKFKRTAETGEPADFEVWYEGQGFKNWFHFRAAKLDGLLLATAEDITERKKTEETIQQMLNGSIAAIAILQSVRDEDGKIVDFKFKGSNKAADSLNRMSNEALIGKNLVELFPGVKEVFFDTYVKVVETGEPLRVQRHYSKEHFNNWFDVSAVKNGDGFILTYHDITEQKKAEKELVQLKEKLTQKATDKYRKIINSMDEGFCILKIIRDSSGACVDYRYLETNPIFEAQTGLKDVKGKTVNELVPNLENYWKEIYGNVASTGEPVRFEDYAEPLEKWFDVNAFRIDAPNEQHVALIFKDITERKEAEERKTFLLKMNDAIRPLEDAAKIQETAMHILGTHLEVNRAYYSEILEDEDTLAGRLGYVKDNEPLTGRVKISDFSAEVHKQLLEGKTLVQTDISTTHRLNEYAKDRISASQVRGLITVPLVKKGKLVALVAIQQQNPRRWTAQEVALVEEVCEQTWAAIEKAQAEKALRESEQRFRNLVEASALAVWETEPDGTVFKESSSWRDFTGQTYEEALGKGWINAVHEEDRSWVETEWKKAVSTNTKFDIEFRLMGASGEARWVNAKAIPILNMEGEVAKWSGMHIDIHDRKQAEEESIRAKEEAEAASRAKEDFLSTMSHEIRTPLNAVIGLTNLLLDKNPREDQKDDLGSLSFSAKNLLALINDILDFSKLEAGKAELTVTDFDLHDLLLNLKQAHQPIANEKQTALILQIGEEVPARIAADQLKLSQVLHNLVSNAVKFTSGGEVQISVDLEKREKKDFWLNFIIKDTGIGISEEKVEHIFEKFTQAESSTVRQYGGTGLGLSITRLLLGLMNSEIKLDSKPGEGSVFYFSLPVKKAKKETGSPARDIKRDVIRDVKKLKVLLVEDVEINRKIILQFFQSWWQIRPDEARTGKEGVEMASQNSYDLILMDIRMPVMDGYEATQLIRELPGYENVPILALTADKNQEVQQVDHKTKFSGLLTKPFEPMDLKEKILLHLPHYTNGSEGEGGKGKNPTSGSDPNPVVQQEGELMSLILNRLEEYRKNIISATKEKDHQAISDLQQKSQDLLDMLKLKDLSGQLKNSQLLISEGSEKERLESIEAVKIRLDKIIERIREEVKEPSFEVSRYRKLAGKNKKVLEKLIKNSIKTMEIYREEFEAAAMGQDQDALSDLVHKNTTSIHYLQANRLKLAIHEFREWSKVEQYREEALREKLKEVLLEFGILIAGLNTML